MSEQLTDGQPVDTDESTQDAFSRYQATVRLRPSSSDVRAVQPSSRSAFSVEPTWRATWPGRSTTCSFSVAGFPHSSSTRSAISDTDASRPVAMLITSPATAFRSASITDWIASASSAT